MRGGASTFEMFRKNWLKQILRKRPKDFSKRLQAKKKIFRQRPRRNSPCDARFKILHGLFHQCDLSELLLGCGWASSLSLMIKLCMNSLFIIKRLPFGIS